LLLQEIEFHFLESFLGGIDFFCHTRLDTLASY
jgi:hypothetical protein